VFPLQRKLRLRVVKALTYRGEGDLLPARGAVARLATLSETSAVRILVAIGTLVEWNSRISRPIIRTRRMALGALNMRVDSGQGIAGLRVVELDDTNRLPIFEVVALLTGLTKPSLVRILVTGSAAGRQT
jgi:hypothetical protein